MEQPNKPTIGGYLELLIKAMVATILLIFMGVGCAALALLIPFIVSLVLVLALVGGGCCVFNWTYVFVGTIVLLILFGMTLK